MKRKTVTSLIHALIATVVLLHQAQGQAPQTYTSLQAWQTAVAANWQFLTSFQGITQDTYFQNVAANVGPFSLAQNGQDPNFGLFRNFIDVPPLQFADNSGANNAALYTKYGVTTVNLSFTSPVFAWGANFHGAQTGELVNLVLTAPGGSTVATIPVTVDTGFFGFVITSGASLQSIKFASRLQNPVASVGQGFGLENITGAYVALPSRVPSTSVAVSTTGLVYNRVTQTYNGKVTVANVGSYSINAPLQVVFPSLPSGVTLTSALGTYAGSPYVTANVTNLPVKGSVTVNVQFTAPANTTIKVAPVIYSGGFN